MPQFNITPTAGANGTISPAAVIAVESGQSAGFYVAPSAFYKVATFLVDGVSQVSHASFNAAGFFWLFTNVTAIHTIAATFSASGAVLSTPLVGLTQVKSYLKRLSAPDTTYDDMLNRMIDYATGQIEKYCARRFVSRVYATTAALLHDGDGTQRLRVREWPVTTLTAVRERYQDGVTATRTLNITGAEIERNGRVIYLPLDGFPEGDQNIEVDCTAGYLAGKHDAEIKALEAAALRWIQVMWQDQEHGIGRGTGISAGGESISFIDQPMPKDVERALLPFVRLC
jgi:hypothetical protein